MINTVVHIVDDDEPVRRSLAFLLASAGFAVRTHASAMDFLAIAPDVRDGCLLTDVRMPVMDGLELLKRLQEIGVTLPTVVVTGHADIPLAVEAMRNGALDFLEKPYSDEALLGSIERAATAAQQKSAKASQTAATRSRIGTLSMRETQVLNRIVSGLPSKTIARELGLSPRTIEVYRSALMAKMHAHSLPDLVRMVVAAGFDVAHDTRHPSDAGNPK